MVAIHLQGALSHFLCLATADELCDEMAPPSSAASRLGPPKSLPAAASKFAAASQAASPVFLSPYHYLRESFSQTRTQTCQKRVCRRNTASVPSTGREPQPPESPQNTRGPAMKRCIGTGHQERRRKCVRRSRSPYLTARANLQQLHPCTRALVVLKDAEDLLVPEDEQPGAAHKRMSVPLLHLLCLTRV